MLLLDLFEGKEEYVANQYGDKLVNRYYEDIGVRTADDPPEETPLEIVNQLAQASRKYLTWVVKQYVAKQFRIEDIQRLYHDLKEFDRVKNRLEVKDINQYPTLRSLYHVLKPYSEQEVVSKKQLEKNIKEGGATKVFEDKSGSVYRIHTKEAACLFGRGTKWCTAATQSENYFDDYNSSGPLYVIITKPTNDKYQFHFHSGQFMDAEDGDIDLGHFAEQYPKLAEASIEANLKYISRTSRSNDQVGKAMPFLSPKLQSAILKKDYEMMAYIPKEDRTKELCMITWSDHPNAYWYFPDKFKTLKMSIKTARRIYGTGTYWADIIPREHFQRIRDYEENIKKLRKSNRYRQEYMDTLKKLQSHAAEIKPEHKEQFNNLVNEYKQNVEKTNRAIREVQAFMKKLQADMNKP